MPVRGEDEGASAGGAFWGMRQPVEGVAVVGEGHALPLLPSSLSFTMGGVDVKKRSRQDPFAIHFGKRTASGATCEAGGLGRIDRAAVFLPTRGEKPNLRPLTKFCQRSTALQIRER